MTKLIFPKEFKQKLKSELRLELLEELGKREIKLDSSSIEYILEKTQYMIESTPKFDSETAINRISSQIDSLEKEKKRVSTNPINKEFRSDFINEVLDKIELPKDGKDGSPGEKGKDGKNYSLTDQDRLDIADTVELKGFMKEDLFTKRYLQLIQDIQSGKIKLPNRYGGASGPEIIAKISKALNQDDWIQGGATNELKLVTSDYTLTQDDFIVFADASSNTVDVRLPVEPKQGNVFVVKCTESTFSCNVLGNGNDIDGLAIDRNLLENQAETYQYDVEFGWGIRYNPAVQDGTIYLAGNEKIDGSIRLVIGIDPAKVRFEEMTDGVWNATSIEVDQASVSIGRNLELSAAGEWLNTSTQQDKLESLVPHLDFDENGSVSPHVPNMGKQFIRQFVSGSFASQVIGKTLSTHFVEPRQVLATRFYFLTGSVGTVSQTHMTITEGSPTGTIIWERTLPISTFASPFTEVEIDIRGAVQNIPNAEIYVNVTSENDVSFVSDNFGIWLMAADFWRFIEEDFIMDDRLFTVDLSGIMDNDLNFIISKGII